MTAAFSSNLTEKYMTAADAAMLIGGNCNANKIYYMYKRQDPIKIRATKYGNYTLFNREDIKLVKEKLNNPETNPIKKKSNGQQEPIKFTLEQASKFLNMGLNDTFALLEKEKFVPDGSNKYLAEDIELLKQMRDMDKIPQMNNDNRTITVKEVMKICDISLNQIRDTVTAGFMKYQYRDPSKTISSKNTILYSDFLKYQGTLNYNRWLKVGGKTAKSYINMKIYDPNIHTVPKDFDANTKLAYKPHAGKTESNRKASDKKEYPTPVQPTPQKQALLEPKLIPANPPAFEPDNNIIKKILFTKTYTFPNTKTIELNYKDVVELSSEITKSMENIEDYKDTCKLIMRYGEKSVTIEYYHQVDKMQDPEYLKLVELQKKFGVYHG